MAQPKGDQTNVGLQDLIVRGPVEKGFYVGYGTREIIPMALEMLVKRMSPDRLDISQNMGQLIWIDSGNAFDPYKMAVAARERGLNPSSVLRSVRIARPFTAFQLHEMLAKVPEGGSPPLVIISDLMSLFYDSEIQEDDVQRAFKQFVQRLSELKKRAIVVALLVEHQIPPQRRHLVLPLLNLAHRVFMPPVTASRIPGFSRQLNTQKVKNQATRVIQSVSRVVGNLVFAKKPNPWPARHWSYGRVTL